MKGMLDCRMKFIKFTTLNPKPPTSNLKMGVPGFDSVDL